MLTILMFAFRCRMLLMTAVKQNISEFVQFVPRGHYLNKGLVHGGKPLKDYKSKKLCQALIRAAHFKKLM